MQTDHKFHCDWCRIFIFGYNADRLAANLNIHNELNHRNEAAANWNAASIVCSSHYIGPASKPRVEYTVPHGTSKMFGWGDAKKAPDITQDDLDMLASEGIKW
jgi:hypothetical protein